MPGNAEVGENQSGCLRTVPVALELATPPISYPNLRHTTFRTRQSLYLVAFFVMSFEFLLAN